MDGLVCSFWAVDAVIEKLAPTGGNKTPAHD
jgi:hypothetical protein